MLCILSEPTAEDQAYPVSNVEEEEMDDMATYAQLSATPSWCGLQPLHSDDWWICQWSVPPHDHCIQFLLVIRRPTEHALCLRLCSTWRAFWTVIALKGDIINALLLEDPYRDYKADVQRKQKEARQQKIFSISLGWLLWICVMHEGDYFHIKCTSRKLQRCFAT